MTGFIKSRPDVTGATQLSEPPGGAAARALLSGAGGGLHSRPPRPTQTPLFYDSPPAPLPAGVSARYRAPTAKQAAAGARPTLVGRVRLAVKGKAFKATSRLGAGSFAVVQGSTTFITVSPRPRGARGA
jgi:hypothetical protein